MDVKAAWLLIGLSSVSLFGARPLPQPKTTKCNFTILQRPPLQTYHSVKRYELGTCCTCQAL